MLNSSTDLKKFFDKEGKVLTYKKGEQILFSHGKQNRTIMITSGIVRLYEISSSKAEQTGALFSKNHIFPISWLANPPPEKPLYYYEAFTDVSCIEVDRDKLFDFISKRADILLFLLSLVSQAVINTTARIISLVSSDLDDKLYFILFYLATRLSYTAAKPIAEIKTAITHDDIAKLVGATREATSSKLSKLKKDGVYWKKNNNTYIDLSKIDASKIPKIYKM